MPVGADLGVGVRVVEDTEAPRDGMEIRRHARVEECERRIAVGTGEIAEDLIVRPVFLDDVDDVFERAARAHDAPLGRRWISEPGALVAVHRARRRGELGIRRERDAPDAADAVGRDVARLIVAAVAREGLELRIRGRALAHAVDDVEREAAGREGERGRIPAGWERAEIFRYRTFDGEDDDGVGGGERCVEPLTVGRDGELRRRAAEEATVVRRDVHVRDARA